MKLNYKRIILVGFAFFLIQAFWQAYDNTIPMILTNKFGMSQAWSGAIMALDNVEGIKSFADMNEISEKVRELKRLAVITSSQARRAKFDIFPMNPLTLDDNKTLIMFDGDKKDKLTGRAEMNIYR